MKSVLKNLPCLEKIKNFVKMSQKIEFYLITGDRFGAVKDRVGIELVDCNLLL